MNLGRESETIEFKKSTSELKDSMLDVASILNKHGKGTLYFGVKPNGDVCIIFLGVCICIKIRHFCHSRTLELILKYQLFFHIYSKNILVLGILRGKALII